MKYIKGLDTLRAFAVFLVVIEHFGVWFNDTTNPGKFIRCFFIPSGAFGVNLFFVLSGFLITSILLKAKEASTSSPGSIVANFYARRSIRIFPIYYLLLFLLYAIHYPDVREHFWFFATYTSNILSYNTNSWNSYGHTWTLAVEEQFYLIWPWLIVFVNNKYVKYILLSSILVGIFSPMIGMAKHPNIGPLLVYHSFDAFAIGGIFAWVQRSEMLTQKFIAGVKILVIPALCTYFYWRNIVYNENWFPQIYLIKICYSIISMWVIILVITNKSKFIGRYLLENKALNYIGKISYGIYLYHLPYIIYFQSKVNNILANLTQNHPTLTRIVQDHHVNYWIHIVMIFTIAGLSFKFIETPLLRLKKRFNYNNNNKSHVVVASIK